VNTLFFDESDYRSLIGQFRGAQFRQGSPRFLSNHEEAAASAEKIFDEAALTDTCIKKNSTGANCPATSAAACCWCDDTRGCTCEAHYKKFGRSNFWSRCEDHKGGKECKCYAEAETAKAAVKMAVGAITGSSTGSKIAYQILGAMIYWMLFVKRGPKERGQRKQVPPVWVPPDMLGPLNDGEWKFGAFECCGDCAGTIISCVLFTPRMATTYWAMGAVTTKDPNHAWIWSWIQIILCFPCFPIFGLFRRGKIRDMFKMRADFGTDLCCWCCCGCLMICQEARLVDAAQGLKQGLCGMGMYYPPAPGPSNIIINGKRQDAIPSMWNVNHLGQECKGKLLVDATNLFGKNDFAIDCSGGIVLMSRGDVSFTVKCNKAAAAGAKAAIIFANEDNEAKPLMVMPSDPGVAAPKIPAVYVSKKVGTGLIGMLDQGIINIELQFGLDLQNDLCQVELQRCLDKEGKVAKKGFGGYLKEGLQFVPGGSMKGNNQEEIVEGLKKHDTFPATCIFAPSGSKTDVPKQEEM